MLPARLHRDAGFSQKGKQIFPTKEKQRANKKSTGGM
jgi:hypothetical protein